MKWDESQSSKSCGLYLDPGSHHSHIVDHICIVPLQDHQHSTFELTCIKSFSFWTDQRRAKLMAFSWRAILVFIVEISMNLLKQCVAAKYVSRETYCYLFFGTQTGSKMWSQREANSACQQIVMPPLTVDTSECRDVKGILCARFFKYIYAPATAVTSSESRDVKGYLLCSRCETLHPMYTTWKYMQLCARTSVGNYNIYVRILEHAFVLTLPSVLLANVTNVTPSSQTVFQDAFSVSTCHGDPLRQFTI